MRLVINGNEVEPLFGSEPNTETPAVEPQDQSSLVAQLQAENAQLQAALDEQLKVNLELADKIQRIGVKVRRMFEQRDPAAYAQPSGVQEKSRPQQTPTGARMPDEVLRPGEEPKTQAVSPEVDPVVEAMGTPGKNKELWRKFASWIDDDDADIADIIGRER
jgi:hypothetical protein